VNGKCSNNDRLHTGNKDASKCEIAICNLWKRLSKLLEEVHKEKEKKEKKGRWSSHVGKSCGDYTGPFCSKFGQLDYHCDICWPT